MNWLPLWGAGNGARANSFRVRQILLPKKRGEEPNDYPVRLWRTQLVMHLRDLASFPMAQIQADFSPSLLGPQPVVAPLQSSQAHRREMSYGPAPARATASFPSIFSGLPRCLSVATPSSTWLSTCARTSSKYCFCGRQQ